MGGPDMEISVVIPVYGCREALPELHRRLTETLNQITDAYEIILVDDCCPQGSWEDIVKLCHRDKKVVGIHLSRNFGQMRAITAGIDRSCGDWVVIMDCDLQDPPEAIKALYSRAKEGYDIVFARRLHRKENPLTMFFSNGFYKLYNYFTDTDHDRNIGNLSIANRRVIGEYQKMEEQNRDYILFLEWLGFRRSTIEVESCERAEGKSSYTFRKKVNIALDLITAYSNKPLRLSVNLGFLFSVLSFLYLIFLVVQYAVGSDIVPGWTSIIASTFLMGGLLMIMLGIVGIYVGNIFMEEKKRPLYVIQEQMNGKTGKEKNPDRT